MSIEEALAPVKHDSHTCDICMDIDITEFYMNEATSWKARLALLRLMQIIRSWHVQRSK